MTGELCPQGFYYYHFYPKDLAAAKALTQATWDQETIINVPICLIICQLMAEYIWSGSKWKVYDVWMDDPRTRKQFGV